MVYLITVLLVLSIGVPFGHFLSGARSKDRFKFALAGNILSFFAVMVVTLVCVATGNVGAAEEVAGSVDGMKYLAAALSTGLATIGAGIAVSASASAAIGAMSENEGIMGKALIFVALAEGIALYGLLVTFTILG